MSFTRLSCPKCQKIVQASHAEVGATLNCPGCGARLVVSDAASRQPRWYYAKGAREPKTGPVSWTDLRELVARGALEPTDLLWSNDAPQSVPAGSFPGLFTDSPVPSPPTPAPMKRKPPPVEDSDTVSLSGIERSGPLTLKGYRVGPQQSITLGDFQILRKLGGGAMGAVYLARQRSLDRLIALKVLSRRLASLPGYVLRFQREAAVMASLDHTHLVRLYGVGEEHGLPYYAMEFIDGFNLNTLLERRGGRLAVGDALHIVLACADALRSAHEKRIVHRDVKPTNILISRLGVVKLTDLGLAKPLDEDVSLTDSGVGVGTPQYMAPEQGRSAKHVDHRADIYALGGVLYRMVTGELPFRGDTPLELMLAKEEGLFVSPRQLNRDVPSRLELVIDKMLAKDLRHRYQSCAEVIRDIQSLGAAHEHLSFNPLQVAPSSAPAEASGGGRVEILLVQSDARDVLLAQEALDEKGVSCNLNVVGDGREALAFLRREDKYASAPRPNLIIEGGDALDEGRLETVASIKADESLRDIPLIVLTTTVGAAEVLRNHGLLVSLHVSQLGELEQIQQFITCPISGSTVAVVELPSRH